MSQIRDLNGQVFGRLTVIRMSYTRNSYKNLIKWVCKCSCGKEVEVLTSNLVRGITRSCGCLKTEYRELVATRRGFFRKDFGSPSNIPNMFYPKIETQVKNCVVCGREFTVVFNSNDTFQTRAANTRKKCDSCKLGKMTKNYDD